MTGNRRPAGQEHGVVTTGTDRGRSPDFSTPVLIVGGGPVGLATAIELSFHGIASLVIEPRPTVSWLRPRAKTTSARTMEHFRRWGIASAVRERAPLKQAWSDEVVFCTSLLGREVARFGRCLALDLFHDDLVAEGGQQVPQPLIEEVMRETVTASPHGKLMIGWTVCSLEQQQDGVTAQMCDGNGTRRTVQAAYAVGCDGSRSIVRDAIGAALIGRADVRPNFNIVFRSTALASHIQHGNAVQYWVLNSHYPGVVGRLDLIDQWWCGLNGVDAEQGAANATSLVRKLIGDERSQVDVEVLATDPWRARMQLADRYSAGRVFLAGDAAHQNPPWGGHGFNTGVGDAVNIGWKLAAVLNGWASADLLGSYELERRPVAAETIAVASQHMAILAPELADPRLVGSDDDFAAAQPVVEEAVHRLKYGEFHSNGFILGTSYANSRIVAGEGTNEARTVPNSEGSRPSAAPGHRLPHRWLSDGRSLYDLLGREFSLVGDVRGPAARALSDAADQLRLPLTLVKLPAGEAQRYFNAPLVLVRPDQHIAWRGTEAHDGQSLLSLVAGNVAFNGGRHVGHGDVTREAATARGSLGV